VPAWWRSPTRTSQEGSKVIICAAGVAGVVIIRRIEQDLYPGESYYGVEFGEPNSRLGAMLHERFVAREIRRPHHLHPEGLTGRRRTRRPPSSTGGGGS
jgi:hypothetical protein